MKFGYDSELETLELLKEYFKDKKLKKTREKYCEYDFYSKTKRIELKTRNNTIYTYPTTMIGVNKIKNAESFEGDYYFAFKFKDGLYYIKYDKKLFETFEIKLGGRCDRYRIEQKLYYFIPIENLTEI